MTIRVLLFGPQAIAAGSRTVEVELGDDDSAPVTPIRLRAALAEAVPPLRESLPSSRIAVNHQFADESRAIAPEDEVALIGMVSGG